MQQHGGPRRERPSAAAAPPPLTARFQRSINGRLRIIVCCRPLFPILLCMNFPPPPPPAPGQLERDAHIAAAENDRAVSSPVIHFFLSCVPYDPSGSPLQPARTRQRLTVLVHAGRTQRWFWMQVQQHLSRLRDSRPVFPNLFIDPALSQATIDLANSHQPNPPPPAALRTQIMSPPLLPPPLPPTSDSRDEGGPSTRFMCCSYRRLPPQTPSLPLLSLLLTSGVRRSCCAAGTRRRFALSKRLLTQASITIAC